MKAYGRMLIRWRVPLFLLVVILLAFSYRALPGLEFDLSIVPLLRASKSAKKELDTFHRDVPRRPFPIGILLEWPREVTSKDLKDLRAAHKKVQGLPEVLFAESLITVKLIPKGMLLPIPVPITRVSRRRSLESILRDHPLLTGSLISTNGRACAIYVASRARGPRLLEALEGVKEGLAPEGVKVRIIGGAVIERAMNESLGHDMVQSLVLETLVFLIILPLLFRSVRGVVLPLFVVQSAVILNFGLMIALGRKLTIIGVAIPGLIAVIGLCDAIHMLHRFEESLAEGRTRDEAILEMLQGTGWACFFTSLTTGIGFLSLSVAPHDAVRDFSISASLAVAAAFASIVLILPICLALWPVRGSQAAPQLHAHFLGYGRPKLTYFVSGFIILFSLLGVSKIVIDSRWLEELPERSQAVEEYGWFEENFHGIVSLRVQLEGDVTSLESLRAMEEFSRSLEGFHGLKFVETPAHWIREVLGQPKELTVEGIEEGKRRLKMLGKRFPRHIVSQDYKKAVLICQIRELGTRHFMSLVEEVEAKVTVMPRDLRVKVGSYTRLAHESSRLVVRVMVQSLLLSLVCIGLLNIIIFRSLRIGLLSMIPNTLPILVALGINGWLQIELRIGIIMIYSLGIGLAVDDTIHLITRFTQERAKNPQLNDRQCLQKSLESTGMALIMTSVLLTFGTLCFLPSSFKTLRDVGILLTPIVISALLGDLFLLPLLLEQKVKAE